MATPDLPNLTGDGAVPKLGWEQVIQEYHYQIQECAVTEDFSYCNAIRLQESTLKIDYVTILEKVAPDAAAGIKKDLGDLLIANVKVYSECFDALAATVNGIKDDNSPSQSDWVMKINDDADAQLFATAVTTDFVKDKAISIIKAAPPEAQNAAANFYLRGVTIVSNVLQAFTTTISKVLSKIGEFVQKIFSGLTVATNYVKIAAEGALNILNIILHIPGGTVPGRGGKPPPPEVCYTGRINWPVTAKFTSAGLALNLIENDLASHGYTVSEEDLKKDETGLAAVVTFRPNVSWSPRRDVTMGKNGEVSNYLVLEEMEDVWKDAVSQLDLGAGHWIPPIPGADTAEITETVKSSAVFVNGS